MLSSRLTAARRPHLVHTVMLAGLLSACAYLPGAGSATPQPTSSPEASPSASLTPEPTVVPTSGHIDHPAGATDIVLRYEQGGGFVPIGFLFTQAPTFTLYGDGTVIFQARYQSPADPWSRPTAMAGRPAQRGRRPGAARLRAGGWRPARGA